MTNDDEFDNETGGSNLEKCYCLFSANFLPHLGGVERYTYHLAKKLIAHGNRVFVVTSNTGRLKGRECWEGIEVFRLPCFNLLNGRFPVSKYNHEYRSLLRTLRKEKFDSVIVNTRFYLHSYLGVRFAINQGRKPIVIEHGTDHFTVNNALLDLFGRIYEHFITALIKRNCDSFYGVSANCNAWLKHFHIEPKGILYNAVDIEEIEKLSKYPVENYRMKLGITESDLVVVYIGRLVKEKGILKLIEAIVLLHQSHSDVKLIIAGDGPLEKIVNQHACGYIYLLGKIDFAHVAALLTQADVFCLPTDYPEGFPTSVLEAAACRCFVVTTDAGGSRELLVNREYGIILCKNTVEEIAEGIRLPLENQEYRKRAVERAYKQLLERFTWDITVQKLLLAGAQEDNDS